MKYEITEKYFTNEDNVTYLGYGILARDGILKLEIEDVSTDRLEVEAYITTLSGRRVPFCKTVDTVQELIIDAYAL